MSSLLIKRNILLILMVFASCQSESVKDKPEKTVMDGDELVPRKYKSIYIHNFDNSSYEGVLTGEVKDILTQKMSLQQRFRLELVRQEADIWLYGKIEYYKLMPRDIDQFGRTTLYNMTVIATVWARPNPKVSEETIFDKKTIRFDTSYSPEQPPFETEFSARQRVIDGLCERIVRSVITGWYSDLKSNEELGYDPAKQKKLLGN